MIEFKNISKSYGNQEIIKDFNLTIECGTFLTIIGSSGSGKTTILKMINGLIKADKGEVLINNKNIQDEDLIEQEDVVITLTKNGYIKRLANTEFKAQRRGGRGVQGMSVHDDDYVENMISCSTHDSLLFFTNTGKVYQAKGYEIPEYSRTAKGLPVINLLNIDSAEKIQAIISVPESDESERYLFFTTLRGTVKRVRLSEFKNIRTNGLRAIQLREDDELIRVVVTSGNDGIILGTERLWESATYIYAESELTGR